MKPNIALPLGLAALVGLGAVLPAAAQTTTAKPATTTTASAPAAKKFYVSLKSGAKGCEVVSVKPSSKLMVGKHSFKTEADASKALAADKACKA
ncbi:hypothetical protein WDZ92_47915 [Nostoc sp. NIES-2111]